jgi:hypothetical protein
LIELRISGAKISGQLSKSGCWSRKAVRVLGAVLVVAVLAACAAAVTKETPIQTKQELVKARAQERWDLVVKGNQAAAYEYLSKGSKQAITRAAYVDTVSRTNFRAAKVDSAECQEEACRVTVSFAYDYKLLKGMPSFAREDWIVEDGQFWYVWLQ